jgi:amino acid transporter
MSVVKRVFVGRPIASTQMEEQKLSKKIALAVFSSDALSSTAYATEEILFVIAVGSSSLALGLSKLVPISFVVAFLLVIVITSYRQVVFAYPGGGGAYIVSKENISETAGLVAGASLMVDYILTVAVSISAGVAAIVSIPQFEELRHYRVPLGLALILLVTLLNMRGVKESGQIFAIPTYAYVVMLAGLIVYGLYRSFHGDISPVPFSEEHSAAAKEFGGSLGVFFLLKGFSSGAVALTGVEAISNGVPAFRRPSAKNAATTLVWMGILLGTLFFGVSLLASRLHPYPSHEKTVISQLGLQVFGNGPIFFTIQIATALILVLAANTAYNGFPSLSSIIAKDGYLPRQLANRGDRLVFSNGIIVLAGSAALLIIGFKGVTNALIPLYAVGVFTSFTLSQYGMVRFHRKHREPAWKRGTVVNFIGGTATLTVLLIVATTKFTDGAWLPLAVIPAIVIFFKSIHRHYARVADSLRAPPDYKPARKRHTVIVLASRVHAGVLEAIAYGQSVHPDKLVAVTVASDPLDGEKTQKEWTERGISVPLEVVYAPGADFTEATLGYVDEIARRWPNSIVTVLIPELYVQHWWQQLLHNQSALALKGRLLFRKQVVVTSIPYRVEELSPA